ncbi:MAG: MFS transporter [Formosimonas sp.]
MKQQVKNHKKIIWGLQLSYICWGVFWGGWGVVLPSLKRELALNDAVLGSTLMAISIGAIPAMVFGNSFVLRFRRYAIFVLLLVFSVCVGLLGFASDAWALLILLVLLGVSSGLLDVALNVGVSHMEHETQTALFQKMHGVFPLGVIVTSPIVGMARDFGITNEAIMLAMGAVFFVPVMLLFNGLPSTNNEINVQGKVIGDIASRFTVLLKQKFLLISTYFIVIFLFIEHAIENWSTLYIETEYKTSATLASLAPMLYMSALFLGRMFASKMSKRIMFKDYLYLGSLGTMLSLIALSLSASSYLSLFIFCFLGLCMAPVVPAIYGAISSYSSPTDREKILSTVTTCSYLGYLISPLFFGGISGWLGLGDAWSVLAVFGFSVLSVFLLNYGVMAHELNINMKKENVSDTCI